MLKVIPIVSASALLLIGGCGGGGTSGGGSNPPPPPTFALQASPASITLNQGGASQSLQVTVNGKNSFAGTVSVSISGLPAGVAASPSTLSVAAGASGSFALSAPQNVVFAEPATVTLSGTSGSLNASATVQVGVTGAPIAKAFYELGGDTANGFYDARRKLLFVTNPGLNELDVVSTVDMSVKARVPVPAPWGIDQMADGKTLVLGTNAQNIMTVDEDTLAVAQYPDRITMDAGSSYLSFLNVVAMANGKVLVIGAEEGIASNDMLDGGQFLFEWDSTTHTFTQIAPSPGVDVFEVDSLTRSADHKWAVFAGDQFYLYSSDSDSMATAPVTVVNPPDDNFGVRGYAINGDGSEIAVASAKQVTFLDRSLSVLATIPIPSAFQGGQATLRFTPDNSKLLVAYGFPLSVVEIDATSHATLGYIYGDTDPNVDSGIYQRLLGVDAAGQAYAGVVGGVRLIDLTQTPIPIPSNGNMAGAPCPEVSAALPLNSTQQVQLPVVSAENVYGGIDVYVGGKPAPLSADGTTISIPASSTSGFADVECIDGNGNTFLETGVVSYGASPLVLSSSLFPPTGNPYVWLYGYGFYDDQSSNASITIGGQAPVSMTEVGQDPAFDSYVLQVPSGSGGGAAPIALTSAFGSGSLTGAAYYPAATIVPASGLLQLLYDSHRSLLYALKANEVDVFDPATMQWVTPIPFPPSLLGTTPVMMALTPDGSTLVVETATQTALDFAILDPTGTSPPGFASYAPKPDALLSGSMAITSSNTVILASASTGGPGVQLDLSSLTFGNPGLQVGNAVKASADGSSVFSVQLDLNTGGVYQIDTAKTTEQQGGLGGGYWSDLAVSADGTQCAAIYGIPDGENVGFFNKDAVLLNVAVASQFSLPDEPPVPGATFGPAGKVLVIGQLDSVEVWDATLGTLRDRILTPEPLQPPPSPNNVLGFSPDWGIPVPAMALDSTGKTIFAISASGLTVMQLPQSVDDLPASPWPSRDRGSPLAVHSYQRPALRMAAKANTRRVR